MRSPRTLRQWIQQLLPHRTPCAHGAARALILALLQGSPAALSALARALDRPGPAKLARQYLERWLEHPTWDALQLYAQLNRLVRRHLRRQPEVLLLLDITSLGKGWNVLQVSIPWQGRALPLLRLVHPYTGGAAAGQAEMLGAALHWLARHLPGPRHKYLLVADRGFASVVWARYFQQRGFRFVLRVKHNWKAQCAEFTGRVSEAAYGPTPRLYRDVRCGYQYRWWQGQPPGVQAHLVCYRGTGHRQSWCLFTSEAHAERVVAIYTRRMQIEQEFRDLKGPLGLDDLARWTSATRVASLLAWVAVYEWRLVYHWLFARLQDFAPEVRIGGALSWIRTTREWIARQLREAHQPALDCL